MFRIIPSKSYIINKSSILPNGKFIVVEQGDDPIKGYSNNFEQSFKTYNKVLLFGDHTTSIYKPESNFLLATDGIKIIVSKRADNNNFIKALFESNPIKSQGYKRHTKILKSKYFDFISSFDEKEKIGNIFEKIDKLIDANERKQKLSNSFKSAQSFRLFILN